MALPGHLLGPSHHSIFTLTLLVLLQNTVFFVDGY